MACALCISNAPQRIAFPHRLTGSCPLNATLSAKSTSFFAITVPDRANLRSDRPSGSTGHPGSAAGALRLAPKSRVQANCYAGADYIVPFSAILSAQQGPSHPSNAIPIQRLRRGVGLRLAGKDWRTILSERAQWVPYP